MNESTDFYKPNKTDIEQLRIILESRSAIAVSFEEAEEVGIQLVSLYECLARDRQDTEDYKDVSAS